MKRIALIFLLLTLISLVLTRFLPAPYWIYFLWLSAIHASVCLGLFSLILFKPILDARWIVFIQVIIATLFRHYLIKELFIAEQSTRFHPIRFSEIFMASLSIAWGTIGLFYSVRIIQTWSHRPSPKDVALTTLILSLCLYCLAPLWALMGLYFSFWTLVGLFGLCVFAYGISWLYSRLFS